MASHTLRIIGGQYGSRFLHTPPDKRHTRPYSGRVREAVFNLLRGWFEEANVVDLFAGVGSMGLEAISRGARSVLLVEQDKAIYRLLKENIDELSCHEHAKPMMGDALGSACIGMTPRPVHVLFVDPPYDMMRQPTSRRRVIEQLQRFREVLADPSFVVLRSPVDPSNETPLIIDGFDGPEVHRYAKDMFVLLYQPQTAAAASDEPADVKTAEQ